MPPLGTRVKDALKSVTDWRIGGLSRQLAANRKPPRMSPGGFCTCSVRSKGRLATIPPAVAAGLIHITHSATATVRHRRGVLPLPNLGHQRLPGDPQGRAA